MGLRRQSKGSPVAEQLHLSDAQAHRDFNVVVVKDQERTIAKTLRYSPHDIQCVGARPDEGTMRRAAWRQVQLMLAYALSVHKAQGLTMDVTYLSLTMVFGFGLPYTACTRTPFSRNMLFVGGGATRHLLAAHAGSGRWHDACGPEACGGLGLR